MDRFLPYINKHIQLTPTEEAILQANIKYKNYLKGQYIVQNDEICRCHSFIESGKVRTFYLDKNGNEHIVAFGIEEWWVGDIGSLITQSPADFNVQCLEKTQVVQIYYENLQRLYRDVPKIERVFRLIIQNAYVSAQKRIVRNFSLTARDRYLLLLEEYPAFVQRFPQYMIASYLGITKEFLSQIRNQLAKEAKS